MLCMDNLNLPKLVALILPHNPDITINGLVLPHDQDTTIVGLVLPHDEAY